MVKADKKPWVRKVAKFKVSKVDKIENAPFLCPQRNCGKRCTTLTAVKSHYYSHPSSEQIPFPLFYRPTARVGKILRKKIEEDEDKLTSKQALRKGREKGQKADTRLRDIEKMKKEVKAYEKALADGETAQEYIGSFEKLILSDV